VDDDAVVGSRATVRDLRTARRRHYLAESDWVDSLYKAYVTVVVSAVALFYLTVAFGGTEASAATLDAIARRGAGWLGLGIAVLVALGLRSGARGGPLAPEPAEVMFLLLAPIDRAQALRSSAYRQLRGVALVPAIAGGVAGSVASGSLGGERAEWIAAGCAAAVLTALTVWGAALVASGTRMRPRVANAIAAALVAWAVIDVVAEAATSPTAQIGRVALLPLSSSAFAALGVVGALATATVGLAVIGGISLEQLRRRAYLLGELRFAATLQDMRSVIVIHRELAQDLPRTEPRWNVESGRGGPCWQRDWRGIARWPTSRIARVVVLAAAAGLACAGVWRGTDALVVVAGVVVFLMGIDAVEGLAQETDHPVLPEQYPVRWGDLVVSHLVVPAVLLAALGLIGLVVFWLASGAAVTLAVAAIIELPVAVAGAVAGAFSIVLGAPTPTLFLEFGFPEFATLWLILRQVLAPLVVVVAFVPAALAADASTTRGASVVGAAVVGVALPVGAIVAVTAWLRSRTAVSR
jgi:hypothetical protein